MFARKNPKGVHFERWRHAYGCGKWFLAARCTATLEVFGTYPAQVAGTARRTSSTKIKARRPGLEGLHDEHASGPRRPPDRPGGRASTSPSTASGCSGYSGDTLASALLANDQMLVGRSFKYHRPRGIVASGPEEPNALVNLGAGRAAGAEPAHHHDRAVRRAGSHQPEPLAEPGIRRGRGEQLRRALPAGGVLLQDLHPSAPVLEACVRADHPPVGGPWQARRRTATPTATNRPMPSATCWWWAAASPGLQAALTAARSGARVIAAGADAPIGAGARRWTALEIDGKPAGVWVDDGGECP